MNSGDFFGYLEEKQCLNINTGPWIQKIKKRHLLVLLNSAQILSLYVLFYWF